MYSERHQDHLPELPDFIAAGVIGSNDPAHPVGFAAAAPDRTRRDWMERGAKIGNQTRAAARLANKKGEATEKQKNMVLAQQAKNSREKKRTDDEMGAYEDEDESKWVEVECSGGCRFDEYNTYENTFIKSDVLKTNVPAHDRTVQWIQQSRPIRVKFNCGTREERIDWMSATDFCRKHSNKLSRNLCNSITRAEARGCDGYDIDTTSVPVQRVNLSFADSEDDFESEEDLLVLGCCPRVGCRHQMEVAGKNLEYHYYHTVKRSTVLHDLRSFE